MLIPVPDSAKPGLAKSGWGVVQIPAAAGNTCFKVLSVPAGSWVVWAPVRIRYGTSPEAVDVGFGAVTPRPKSFGPCEQTAVNPDGRVPYEEVVLPIACTIVVDSPTRLELQLTTYGDDSVTEVLDGDSVMIGWAA